MTASKWDRGDNTERASPIHVVLATHSREVKTALFHYLNAISMIVIAATATSTAELVSYCLAFRPDYAIVEAGLPGRSLNTVLTELGASNPGTRILLVGDTGDLNIHLKPSEIEIFAGLDQLISTFPDEGANAP